MRTSEAINEIAAALAKAQGGMKNAALNKVNPHFKSKYADLAGIRDAVIPALTGNGIAMVQTLEATVEGVHYLSTRLVHTSGQWIESVCPIPNGGDMQKMGSAITYARRYSLSAICGIAADEDDDANEASKPEQVGPRAVPTGAPSDYQKFLGDMTAKADLGMAALTKALNDAPKELRLHLTMQDTAKWEALKKKAALVKVAAHA